MGELVKFPMYKRRRHAKQGPAQVFSIRKLASPVIQYPSLLFGVSIPRTLIEFRIFMEDYREICRRNSQKMNNTFLPHERIVSVIRVLYLTEEDYKIYYKLQVCEIEEFKIHFAQYRNAMKEEFYTLLNDEEEIKDFDILRISREYFVIWISALLQDRMLSEI